MSAILERSRPRTAEDPARCECCKLARARFHVVPIEHPPSAFYVCAACRLRWRCSWDTMAVEYELWALTPAIAAQGARS